MTTSRTPHSTARLDGIVADLHAHGATDLAYLRLHWKRFLRTKALVEETGLKRGARILDVGAHWLHQSCLYATDGHQVTASDLPATLQLEAVQRLAEANAIRLLPCADLGRDSAFDAVPDDAFDVILFTEILEHLAFNPVPLWREIHRVLAPEGRIVLTTPNNAGLRARLRRLRRHALRGSGGLTVDQILSTPTFGHHWKEYTLAELRRYFQLLSPDFTIARAVHVEDYYGSRSLPAALARAAERLLPPLRPHLHVEIALPAKRYGVTIKPAWA